MAESPARAGRLGRWSLRLDAAYCAVLGAAVAIGSGWIATVVAVPADWVLAAGLAVVVWAAAVLGMLVRLPLRRALRLVMAVNLLAAVLVCAVSATAATALAAVGVLAVAADVAIFAASQAIALRRLPV